jgi:hypothetical protein
VVAERQPEVVPLHDPAWLSLGDEKADLVGLPM